MSAIAFAEGGAHVVTLEVDDAIADTAQQVFNDAGLNSEIDLIRGIAKNVKTIFLRNEKRNQVFVMCIIGNEKVIGRGERIRFDLPRCW